MERASLLAAACAPPKHIENINIRKERDGIFGDLSQWLQQPQGHPLFISYLTALREKE